MHGYTCNGDLKLRDDGRRAFTSSPLTTSTAKAAMAARATGTFDVRLNPQPADESGIGRLTIDKQFHGNLEGTSKGHMLAYSTEVQGSAGYVAMERVTGTVGGRSGSFVLQHSATMTRGEPLLVLTVVPDSGTAALADLSGKMAITIVDKKHFYEFEYTLPDLG
jgi:Protein of unknown function (DUF3224)